MAGIELCRRRIADTNRFPLPAGRGSEYSSARLALMFFYELASELEEDPDVFPMVGEHELAVLFRSSCCRCSDLLAQYGGTLARLSANWPVTVCGTVDGTEVGELRVVTDGQTLCWTQSNVSGRPFETLSDLCIKLCPSEEDESFDFLLAALGRMSFRTECIALPKRYQRYCTGQGLSSPIQGAHFCYLSMTGAPEIAGALDSLDMGQKGELWAEFLENSGSFQEFEWVWEAYRAGCATGLLEWELALRGELIRQNIQVTNTADCFQVIGRAGETLRFDYRSPNAAERMFLKILFPVVPG